MSRGVELGGGVPVDSSTTSTVTTRRGALRLIARGLAVVLGARLADSISQSWGQGAHVEKAKAAIELPPDSIEYPGPGGVTMRETIYHGTDGMPPNDGDRPVDTIRHEEKNPEGQYVNPKYYQPYQGIFPETQLGDSIRIVTAGIAARTFDDIPVGFGAVLITPGPLQFNLWVDRIVRFGDLRTPDNKDLQSEFHDGLPQTPKQGESFTKIQFVQGSSGWKLVVGIRNDGDYETPFDSQGNPITSKFIKVQAPTVSRRSFIPLVKSFSSGW